MKTFLTFLLLVAVASAAETHSKRATYEANINEYVDKLMSNVQTYLTENSVDSMSVPNVTQSFSVKPLLITYSGRLSLYNGILSNLASLRRFGDVTLSYSNKVLTISANMGLDSVEIDYTYGAKLMGISAKGTADTTVKSIDVTGEVSANLETFYLALNSFSINSIGTTSARLHGNTLTDWLANAILNLVIDIVKNDVVSDVKDTVTSTLQSLLDEWNELIGAVSLA